jgi:shikimate kinase
VARFFEALIDCAYEARGPAQIPELTERSNGGLRKVTTDLPTGRKPRRVFLAGPSGVGKTTIGRLLAGLIGCRFFDMDDEIEAFFGAPIARVQEALSYAFHAATARVLRDVIARSGSHDCIIVMPGGPLPTVCWDVIAVTPGTVVVVLTDAPENILARVVHYVTTEHRMPPTAEEQDAYLAWIKRDVASMRESGAHLLVDIADLSPAAAADKVREVLANL